MATNGTDIAAELGMDEHIQVLGGLERSAAAHGFALAPLVNKIAYGIARGLVVALKELEDHIASETRKVGDTVDRRLDTFQATLQDLSSFVGAQRSTNAAVDGRLQELTTGLRTIDARQSADTEALRNEAREFSASVSGRIEATIAAQEECNARQSAALAAASEKIDTIFKELGVHQEDIGALKAALSAFSTKVEGLVERLDRQAETVRSMCSAYSQRETELEHLVDGLARLRAFPTPLPANGL
jgi:chromosome segregation ATPase